MTNAIDQVEELFRLKPYKTDRSRGYKGLVYPTGDFSIISYGKPALEVDLQVYLRDESYVFQAVISSIDDSGLTVHGPAEILDKASFRMEKFRGLLADWQYECPTEQAIKEFCQQNNCYADYW